ncbi:HET-domain-containing protein [Xylariaceae sp. AK1471]|nr:HET-domain-containing protein [Xylariaceae sp. AK1471]
MVDGNKFDIDFFTLADDDCPCPDAWDDVPVSTRTSSKTSSEEAFEKAREWLSQCNDNNHGYELPIEEDPSTWSSYCVTFPQILPSLPTRVVDVGRSDGKIKLIEGNGQPHIYLCLSHCWGSQQIITTTRATLAERMQEIRPDDLSATFNEAIWMTRRLEIDYIWIDSLCIVQDDADDWERESAQMASIYHNAYLTLAATRSSSGADGLFTTTPDFEVSGTTPTGEDYYLIFRQKIEHEPEFNWIAHTITRFPLMTRAWAFQERMLSKRVLHFGYFELFFECSTTSYCECDSIGYGGYTEEIPLPNLRKMYSSALESAAETRGGKWSNKKWVKRAKFYIARIWRSLVTFYTSLRLTFASDRLPALRGLASRFAEKRETRYLVGLFEESLLDDLMWNTYAREKPRPLVWRAPSWLWASTDAYIYYRDGLCYYDDDLYLEKPDDRTEFTVIEECHCRSAGLDDYGQVKSGFLRLTGPLLSVILLPAQGFDDNHRRKYLIHLPNIDATPRIWPDYDLDQAGPYQILPKAEVYCLRLVRNAEDKVDISPLLRALPGQGEKVFERIGMLGIMPHLRQSDCLDPETRKLVIEALDKAEIQTVVIV